MRRPPAFIPLALLVVLGLSYNARAGYDTNQSAAFVLGQPSLTVAAENNASIKTSTVGFWSPTDVVVSTTLGKSFVADYSNNRVLIFNSTAPAHGTQAALVLGQANFIDNQCNRGASPNSNTLCGPSSVYTDDIRLVVADSSNHRVLIWNAIPTSIGQAANVVLGQSLLTTNTANEGGLSSATLSSPYGVSGTGPRLFVADTGNHRVLMWTSFPATDKDDADIIIGQPYSTTNSANNPSVSSGAVSGPRFAYSDGARLWVADTDNNRVLQWNAFPTANGQGADVVIGHPYDAYTAAFDNGANTSGATAADNMRSPYGIAGDGTKLLISEPCRVLVFNAVPAANFAAANAAIGQTTLSDMTCDVSQSRLGFGVVRVSVANGSAFIADSANNRVILWNSIPAANGANANRAWGHEGSEAEFVSAAPNAGPYGDGMKAPRGMGVQNGKVVLADTQNNRVLIWNSVPAVSGAPASIVLGQVDFRSSNPRSPPTAASLNAPEDAFYDGQRLFVADTGNNRVLIWNALPTTNNQSADMVVGQAAFTSNGAGTSATALSAPAGVFSDGRRLFIGDRGNNRVMIWNLIPSAVSTPANFVLGHASFTYSAANDAGGGVSGSPTAANMSAPRRPYYDGIRLFVPDSGNHRVLIWNSLPAANFQAADVVVGQPGPAANAANNPALGAASLSSPLSAFSDGRSLYVADNGNHRVLTYHPLPTAHGASALFALGQANLTSASDPGASAASASSPTAVAKDGLNLYALGGASHWMRVWRTTEPANRELYVAISSPAIASFVQGSTRAFIRVDAFTSGGAGFTTLDGLTVFKDTAVLDSSIRAHWYLDDQNAGSSYTPNPVFDAGADTLIEFADFASSAAAFTTDFSIGQTTVTFWVALTLRDLPYSQGSLPQAGLRVIPNFSSFPMKVGELGYIASAVRSNFITVGDSADTLEATSLASPQAPPQAVINSANHAFATIKVRTLNDYAYIKQVNVYKTGNSANIDQVVAVYRDSNGDGFFTQGIDAALSADAPFVGTGTAIIPLSTPQEVGTSTVGLIVVAAINNNPGANEKLFGIRIDSTSLVFDSGSPDVVSAANFPYLTPETTIYASLAQVAAVKHSSGVWVPDNEFIFSGNQGQLNVFRIGFVWDQSPTHAWTGTEADWFAGNSTQTATSAGNWYFHIRAYNAGGNPGSVADIGPFKYDPSSATAVNFQSLSSTSGALGENQWNDVASSVGVRIAVQDATSGLAVSTFALASAGDGHDHPGATGGFGVMYSTNAGQTWIDYSTYTTVLQGTGESFVLAMAAFNGKLYAAPGGTVSRLYESSNGASWSLVAPGISESEIDAFTVFNGRLYAGTGPNARVYSSADGSTWTQVFEAAGEPGILSLAVFKGRIYAGTASSSSDAQVYVSSNGVNWSPSLSGIGEQEVWALVPFNGKLYAGTSPNGRVYSSVDGAVWTLVFDSPESYIRSLAVYNGRIFAGSGTGARIYSSATGASGSWSQVHQAVGENFIYSFANFGGKLYALTSGNGLMFATSNGTQWLPVLSGTGESELWSATPFRGKLYVGTNPGGYVLEYSPVQASVTGADGVTSAQTLSGFGLKLINSTNTATCAGSSSCGATNQVRFTVSDLAGNVRTGGPFAVLIDTITAPAVSTAAFPADASALSFQPNFSWTGPSTKTIAGLGAGPDYLLQVSSADPTFQPGSIVISVSTPAVIHSTSAVTADAIYASTYTLAAGSTYYWRVTVRHSQGAISPWSATAAFQLDTAAPVLSSFTTFDSTGGIIIENQWNNLASGATAQFSVQDAAAGLVVTTSVIAGIETHPAGGPGVLVSTTGGASWHEFSTYTFSYAAGAAGAAQATVVFRDRLYAGLSNGDVQVFDGSSWSLSQSLNAGGAAAFAVYRNRLFTGGGTVLADKVWTYDGSSWAPSPSAISAVVNDFAVYNGRLYAAPDAAEAFFAYDGFEWRRVDGAPSGAPITALAPYNGYLYAATGGAVWRYDGQRWASSVAFAATKFALYAGKLYAFGGGQVRTLDASTWSGSAALPASAASAGVFRGRLYFGETLTGRLFRLDGSNWVESLGTSERNILSLSQYRGRLYLGADNNTSVLEVRPAATAITGADGATAVQTSSATGLSFVASSTSTVCAGAACAATNQLRMFVADRAGNVADSGPFAVLSDTFTYLAYSTPTYPGTGFLGVQPNFYWVGPSTGLIAAMNPGASYVLEVADAPSFNPVNIVLAVSTPAVIQSTSFPTAVGGHVLSASLTHGLPHYWRVRGVSGLGNLGPWSAVSSFTTDFSTPTDTSFVSFNSTGGTVQEGNVNNLAYGVTVQILVGDGASGLSISTMSQFLPGDGHNGPSHSSGYGVLFSTTAGQQWIEWALSSGTMTGTGENAVLALAQFAGRLYAATEGSARIFRTVDGTAWSGVYTGAGETAVRTLAVFNNKLYAGVEGASARVYSSADGGTWTGVLTAGAETRIASLAPYNGRLYAGTGPNAQIYVSTDGIAWRLTAALPGESDIVAMTSFRGRLFAATKPGGKIFETIDGFSWTPVVFGTGETEMNALTVYNGRLYAGSTPNARIFSSADGTGWAEVLNGTGEQKIAALAPFNGKLYASLAPSGRILTTLNGTTWLNSHTEAGVSTFTALAAYKGDLYAGSGSAAKIVRFTPLTSILNGSDGTITAQLLTALAVPLRTSVDRTVCAGQDPCGATNQYRFAVTDRAGGVRSAGPYAVLVDTVPPASNLVSLAPGGVDTIVVHATGTDVIAGLRDFNFEASSSPVFAFSVSSSDFVLQSSWTFTGLLPATTYYVRAVARDQVFNSAPSVSQSTSTFGPVFFSTADAASPTALQNTDAALLRFKLWVGLGGSASFQNIRINLRGTAQDPDIVAAKIYLDADANDAFDGAIDTPLGSAAMISSQAYVDLGANAQLITTSSKTFFVVYQLSSQANVGATIGARIQVNSDMGFSFPFSPSGSFPIDSGFSTVQDGNNNLTLVPSNLAPATVSPGANNLAVLKLLAQTNTGTSELSSMVVYLKGTLASNQITALKVYRDANANGTFESTLDTPITSGSDVFVAGVSTVNFVASQADRTINTTQAQLFLAVNIAPAATPGANFYIQISTPSEVRLANAGDVVIFSTQPMTSTPAAVQVSNTLGVTLQSLTPAGMTQGQSYAVMRASVAVDSGIAEVFRMKVNRTGVSVDGDVSAVKIYFDQIQDGGPWNPAVDTLLGSGSFASGVATIDITTTTITAGTTAALFIVYDINSIATAGDTLGAGMTNNTYVSVVSGFTSIAGNFPFSTSTGAVQNTINEMTLSYLDMTSGGLVQGTTNAALLRLTTRALPNPVTWSALRIQRLGAGADSDVTAVKIFRDSNANDTFQFGTDPLVSFGNDVFTAGVSNVAFSSPQTIGSSTQTYFIAVDLANNAAPGNGIGLRVGSTTSFTLNSPHFTSTGPPAFPLDAGPILINQYPNVISVTTASIAPAAAINPGTQNVGIMKIGLSSNLSNAAWVKLRLDRGGISADSDIAAVKIYYDINSLGVFDSNNIGQYLLVTPTTMTFGSQGTPGTLDLFFANAQTITTSQKTYFVAVDLSTNASPGNTVVLRALDNTYYGFGAPNTVAATWFTSGSLSVATPPTLMTVVGASSAPAAAQQGATNVLALTLKLRMPQYTAQWQGLTVVRTGTGADPDISRIKIYRDSNSDGAFDPLLDQAVATGTLSTGQSNIGFGTPETITTSTATFFVAYDLSATAVTGATHGLTLTGPGVFLLASPHSAASSGFPVASAQTTVLATQNGVTVTFQDRAPASVMQGATGQLMLSLVMNTTSFSVVWNTLTVTRLGTASDNDIDNVRIFKDNNANGAIDGGDAEITSGINRFTGGTASFPLSVPQAIDTSLSRFLLALDMNLFAATTATIGVRISSAAAIGVTAPNFVINSGFPMDSTQVAIAKKSDMLVAYLSGLAPSGINQGAEVPMAKLTVRAQRDRVNWAQFKVNKLGTLADGFITAVRVYRDTNLSGAWDSGDALVGSGVFSTNQASVNFGSVQVLASSPRDYFVNLLLDSNATVSATVGINVQDSTFFTVQSPDAVSGSSLPFSGALANVLDSRTPTTPIVVLDGPYWKDFETLHFVWSSTVGIGTINSVQYAIGTTAGGTELRGFTAISSTVTDHTATGLQLQSGTTYYVSVRAISSSGFISLTGVSSPILVDFQVPATPAMSTIVGNITVLLSWGGSSPVPSGIVGYLLEYRTGSSPIWYNAKTNAISTYTVSGLSSMPLAIGLSDLVTANNFSMTPNYGTLFFRIRAASGSGVLSPASEPIRVQFGPLPKDGINAVSNYPNPFDSRKERTTINYTLSAASDVRIQIFNLFGGKVREIQIPSGAAGGMAGSNDVTWDGSDDGGRKVSKGVYIVVIQGGGAKVTHKIGVIH